MRRAIRPAVLVALLLVWWFYIIDRIDKPGTYPLYVLYITVVLISGVLHVKALIKFSGMVHRIRIAESNGHLDAGSTLFAINQRFRYAVRMIESAVVLVVAAVGILSVTHPAVAMNKNYARLILTYFIGSVVATGYLTYRDLKVVRKMKRHAATNIILKETSDD